MNLSAFAPGDTCASLKERTLFERPQLPLDVSMGSVAPQSHLPPTTQLASCLALQECGAVLFLRGHLGWYL